MLAVPAQGQTAWFWLVPLIVSEGQGLKAEAEHLSCRGAADKGHGVARFGEPLPVQRARSADSGSAVS